MGAIIIISTRNSDSIQFTFEVFIFSGQYLGSHFNSKFLKTCLNEMVDFGVCSAVRPIVAHFSLVSYCAAASIQFSKSDENAIRSDFNSF